MGNRQSRGQTQTSDRNHGEQNLDNNSDGIRAPSEEAPESTEQPETQLSYWQMIKLGYQELVNAIIRPPRCDYEIVQLGPKSFLFCGRPFRRRDFVLRNSRDLAIVCSMWEPVHRPNPVLPCVIYMHGNSSARLEAIPQLSLVLSLGATLVTFDFCGSGLSDGEYVSLGFYEKDDLQCVIEYLREEGNTSTIALWGRSMGAATALLHGERDPSIAGMVLDSAFADLQQLAEEMVEKGRQHGLTVPSFIVRIALRWIRSSVQRSARFDIKDLSPIQHADKCFIPALFIAAEGDDFVPPHHSQQIHDRYAGDKNIVLVAGDHNSMRPKFMFDSVAIFLANTLQVPPGWMLEEGQQYIGQPPWYELTSSGDLESLQLEGLEAADLNDFTLDQLLAVSMMDVGMTSERQQDVRQALYAMLGGDRSVALSASAASARGAGEPIASAVVPPPPPSSSSTPGRPKESQATRNQPGKTSALKSNGASGKPSVQSAKAGVGSEWTCPSCTLMNDSESTDCAACGHEHRP